MGETFKVTLASYDWHLILELLENPKNPDTWEIAEIIRAAIEEQKKEFKS